MKSPIICAIDSNNITQAKKIAKELKDYVWGYKIGLEFFYSHGHVGTKEIIKEGLPIFLDLKLNDIPNTCLKAVNAILTLNPYFISMHISSGRESMETVAKKLKDLGSENKRPKLVGVTILTSLEQKDLDGIGWNSKISDAVKKLAESAKLSGVDGLVCSPLEIEVLKNEFGNDLQLIVPGIRVDQRILHDQKRIMSPKKALDLGANYLVVGRAITENKNPKEIAKKIYKELVS